MLKTLIYQLMNISRRYEMSINKVSIKLFNLKGMNTIYLIVT